jgi:hypothetical protein
MQCLQKNENGTTMLPRNPALGYRVQRNEINLLKRYCILMHVHSQGTELTSINSLISGLMGMENEGVYSQWNTTQSIKI